jgi:predicted ATPase
MTTTDIATTALAEHADAIRALRSRIVSDVAEIGRRLIEVKKIVGHGNWLPWLDREFGWTDHTALNFMRVHESPPPADDGLDIPKCLLRSAP